MILDIGEEQRLGESPLKFENMWMKDAGFCDLIERWWQENIFVGSKLFCFVSKLKSIKQKLLKWNREKFQNSFTRKKGVEDGLISVSEKVISRGLDTQLYEQEKMLLTEYHEVLAKEEVF